MIDAVLTGGGYRAEFSSLGGACLRLTHGATGAELLRTPMSGEERMAEVFLFGNSILFPPNRIRGGKFFFGGTEYAFPQNEPQTGCHLHGALHSMSFRQEGGAAFSYRAEEGEYLGFPHSFSLSRRYSLGRRGLTERTEIVNLSPRPMPVMLAFHTTFNLPFLPGGEGDTLLFLRAEREHLRDKSFLPTERFGTGFCGQLAAGWRPVPVSAFLEGGGRGLIVRKDRGLAVSYEADRSFGYRMLWKDGRPLLVLEPQTCAVDCFHRLTPPGENGLIVLPPGRARVFTTRIGLCRFHGGDWVPA